MAKKSKYTKVQVFNDVSEEIGVCIEDVRLVSEAFISRLKTGLMQGKTIELRGFGSLAVKIRKGRTGARNPRTGAIVKVKDHGVAIFRPGRDIKQAVWELDKLE